MGKPDALSRWADHGSGDTPQAPLPIIIYALVPYVTYLSLIIFKIIPHPMTLLTAFPLQVIILYFI
jgi:hypothetical protein